MALAWGGSTDSTTTGYVVYAFEENTTLLARVDVGGSTYVEIDGLKEGLSYTFYVTAYNPYYVESPPSLAVNFQVPGLVLMVSGGGYWAVSRLFSGCAWVFAWLAGANRPRELEHHLADRRRQ